MSSEQLKLFDIPSGKRKPEVHLKAPNYPVWTEKKAKLIERYLYYFVLITKHGTYIDGFAGPQNPDEHESWSAKLALENEPHWIRKFFLLIFGHPSYHPQSSLHFFRVNLRRTLPLAEAWSSAILLLYSNLY